MSYGRTTVVDRVALVTGATAGFGRACVERLIAEGARVVATGRRQDRLADLATHDRCHAAAMDVRDGASVDGALASLPEDYRAIDLLVNNAGLALGLEPAHRASWQDWDDMIATNVRGLAYVTRAVLPGMVERGRGHVVNISSIAGSYPYPGGNVYGATKAFVTQFSLNLRADLVGTPVRVTSIEPGLAETEFSIVRFAGDAERAGKVYAGTDPITAADIAEAVHWVATLPEHLNVDRLEIMPTCQAAGPLAIHRRPLG